MNELARLRDRIALARLEQEADLRAAVTAARERGATWSEIGRALGVSKRAAAKRFGSRRT